jgi:hypothetical protein
VEKTGLVVENAVDARNEDCMFSVGDSLAKGVLLWKNERAPARKRDVFCKMDSREQIANHFRLFLKPWAEAKSFGWALVDLLAVANDTAGAIRKLDIHRSAVRLVSL